MASVTPRGDKFLAQVRIKQGGVLIFSESRVFDTRPQAVSWGDRLEAKVKAEGPAKHASSKMTVGDLVRKHLDAQLVVRPLLGRSTIHNHHKIAAEFDKVLVRDLKPKHLIDYAIRRKTEDGVTPATIKSDLSPVSAAFGVARIAYLVDADPAVIQEAMHYLDKQGLVGKSREVVRWVDGEEEEALLAEFARRNAHHQTTIDMAQLADVRIVEDVVIEKPGKRPEVKGTKVRSDVLEVNDDTLFPLQGALGYEVTCIFKSTYIDLGRADTRGVGIRSHLYL